MNVAQARGVVLGLACGGALGRPVEFASESQIATEQQFGTDGDWTRELPPKAEGDWP